MVFNLSISSSDDEETPALTPVASPRACSGCVGVIRRFDGPGLQDRSRDRGAVGQMQDENPLGSNDSAGKEYGKKLVVKVDFYDDRGKRKAMQVVSTFKGIGSLSWDLKDSKLTVSGDFDPAKLVNKLRKSWPTDIVSVGPAEEDDGKKDGGKKEEDKKDDLIANLIKAYEAYYPTPVTYYYVPQEETPNCVIC